MSKEVLVVKHLSVQFQHGNQKEEAVQDVSFQVEDGEIVGIVGESGSGKSTVMRSIAGVLSADAKMTCETLWLREGKRSV